MWSDTGGDMEVLSREVRGPSADSERMDVLGLLGPGRQQGSGTGEDAAVGEGWQCLMGNGQHTGVPCLTSSSIGSKCKARTAD